MSSSTLIETEPKITLAYYPDGHVWEGRVSSVTDQRVKTTQYEYDLHFSTGLPCPGRGLVTKITNPDGTTKVFDYDVYGNKLTEQDENGKVTTHTYDAYNRLLSTKLPYTPANPNSKTVFDYTATSGASPLSHTTKSARRTTIGSGTPEAVVLGQTFDANFRLASKIEGEGSPIAGTTSFGYDFGGNQTTITDPRQKITRNEYDNRNRKISTTNALNQVTQWDYDPAGNVLKVTRPGVALI